MKANELMIGDWVLYGDKSVKILQLSENSKYDWVKPIVLTPEILEKNGFIKVNSQRYDYGYPDTDCYVKVNPKKNMIHINGRNANSNLYSHSFVHELQHALRICRLDEFADNFKV